jgi:hypothetical protein
MLRAGVVAINGFFKNPAAKTAASISKRLRAVLCTEYGAEHVAKIRPQSQRMDCDGVCVKPLFALANPPSERPSRAPLGFVLARCRAQLAYGMPKTFEQKTKLNYI